MSIVKVDITDYTHSVEEVSGGKGKLNRMPKAAGLSCQNVAAHPWSYKKIL